MVQAFGGLAATDAIRNAVGDARAAARSGAPVPDAEAIATSAMRRLAERDRSDLRPLFNLTGTWLNTNLGRAVLAEAAIAAAGPAMRDAAALEYDLPTGQRGERDDHVRRLL